ncbi:MAG: tetratricopeptide repeat protein [Nitrospinae bacterium]|nr:tetratricopeptide repeat protein [Nitrospinota bacterium]
MGVFDALTGGGAKKGKQKLDEGLALLEGGNAKDAIPCFDEALKLDPKSADPHFHRAKAKIQLGKKEEALKDLSEAVKLDPNHPKAFGERGLLRVQAGKLAEAVADFSEALRINPQSALLYYNLGSARFKLNQYEEAANAYAQAVKLNPNHAPSWYAGGKTKAALGKKEEAINDFNEAIKLDPKNPKALARRGTLKMALGNPKDALADFDKSIALSPGNSGAYFNRATARGKLGMKEEAILDYDEAIKLAPANAMAYYNRGNGYFALGKYEEAIKDYSRALKLDSTLAWAYYSRSAARMLAGEREKGTKDLEIFVQMTENAVAGSAKIREEAIKHLESIKSMGTAAVGKIAEETMTIDAIKEETDSLKTASVRAQEEGIKEQKFEAIMFIDICKSTNMIDSFGELHYFQKVFAVIDKPLTDLKKQYHCQFEKSTGDGYMLTFNDCASAVNLGISLLHSVRAHNDSTDDPAQIIDLRIGMDCGQVIVKEADSDRIGDAANVAKRIEGLMTESFVELAPGVKETFPEKNRIFASAKVITMLGDATAIKCGEVGWAELKGKVGVRYQISQIDWRESKPGASPGSTSVRL